VENSQSNGPVLEAVGVGISSALPRRVKIIGVDWTVRPGEFWVVGGANGSGKTDLLMTVAGLHRAAAGTVRLFGRAVTEMTEAEISRQRGRLGFVFKGGGRMFTDLTVAENVALALCYHRNCALEQVREEVHELLERIELAPFALQTAQTLGSDWQQRVGLARALALKPEALLLDEPGAGLEARHRQWWKDYLTRLAGGNSSEGSRLTIIVTTNEFAPWRGGNRRYALIEHGHWRVLAESAKDLEIE